MRWQVEVTSVVGDVGEVQEVLSVAGYSLVGGDSTGAQFLLSHEKYASMKSAQLIQEDATNLVDALRTSADPIGSLGIHLGVVRSEDASGRIQKFLVAGAGGISIVGFAPTISISVGPEATDERRARAAEQAQKEEQRNRRARIARERAALANVEIRRLHELLAQPDGLSIDQLGKVVELSRSISGGDLSPIASKNELSRFRRSINHPEVFGLAARHAVPKGVVPANAMTEAQAKELALRVGRWCLAERGSLP